MWILDTETNLCCTHWDPTAVTMETQSAHARSGVWRLQTDPRRFSSFTPTLGPAESLQLVLSPQNIHFHFLDFHLEVNCSGVHVSIRAPSLNQCRLLILVSLLQTGLHRTLSAVGTAESDAGCRFQSGNVSDVQLRKSDLTAHFFVSTSGNISSVPSAHTGFGCLRSNLC